MALEKVTLDNGLTIYNDHVPGAHTHNVSVVLPYGSVHEKEGHEGVAHVFEHAVHLQTDQFADRVALREYAELNGMVTNANTSYTRTQYYGNGVELEPSFVHLSEILQHTHLPEDSVVEELKAVRREALMGLDKPDLLHMVSRDYAMFNKPYGRRVIGHHNDIDFTAEELMALYKQYYTTDNMALIVTGAAQLEEVTHLANKYFDEQRQPSEPIVQPVKSLFDGPRHTGYVQDGSSNVRLSVSHPLDQDLLKKSNESPITYSLASTVMSRACFELLRYEKGLSYDGAVGFDTYNHPDAWLFDGYVTVDAEKIQDAYAALGDIFSRTSDRYTDNDILGALATYRYSFLNGLSSLQRRTDGYVDKIASHQEPRDIETSIAMLKKIEVADVREKIDSIVDYLGTAPRFTHLTGTREAIGDVDKIIDKAEIA